MYKQVHVLILHDDASGKYSALVVKLNRISL